jgi:rubredoxin
MTETSQSLSKSTIRQRRLRQENIKMLGGRCKGPNCRWLNDKDDGEPGCNDARALQFDHIGGGGSAMRRDGKGAGLAGLYYIRNHPELFQLLCANCNWIKRAESGEDEQGGSLKFRQPALVRRSLGQPGRRIREPQELEDRRADLGYRKLERSFLAARKRETTI